MTFTQEELQQIDLIKYHIISDAEKNGVDINEVVTDKVALQYALALADKYVKELYPVMNQSKKGFFARLKSM